MYVNYSLGSPTINLVDNDGPGVSVVETGTSTSVTEGSTTDTDTYSVVLTKAPNGNVAISLTSSSTTVGITLAPASPLLFTAANWSTPQTVTVTAFNDTTLENNHTATAAHAIVTASTTDTTGYATLTAIKTVTALITDNDNPIILTETGADTRIAEDGSLSDTYSVVLRSAPSGANTVAVNLTVPAGQGLAASPTSLTFNSANWSVPQIVTLTGLNTVNHFRHTATITHASVSADTNFNAKTIPSVVTNIVGLDTPQVVIFESSNTTNVSEAGTTDTYSVALSQPPTADVTVALTSDIQVATNVPSLTFTAANWNVFQVVTVRAVDDVLLEATPHYGTITHTATSTDPAFTGVVIASVIAFITDNDAARVIFTQTGGSTVLSEAGVTDSYDVVLSHQPNSDVTVTATPNAQVTVAPASTLTFTSANWNTPQTVVVTAVNDAVTENTHTGSIAHSIASADTRFHAISAPTITATITDNDGPQVTVSNAGTIPTSTIVSEGGATDTITIVLTAPPSAGTTLDVNLVAPSSIIPIPLYAKQAGYFTTDLSGSNQQKDRIVMDYTESILLYRTSFYASLSTQYSGTIPNFPGNTQLQNAHWAATKSLVNQMDMWWAGGGMKARFPDAVLVQPNQTPPSPLPGFNPRQTILEAIYSLNGNATLPNGTTRYTAQGTYDPKAPPTDTMNAEIRDRARYAAYLITVLAPGIVSH
jgi:hypothetical protein